MATVVDRPTHFNTTNFTNEQFSKLLDKGFTVKEIERFHAQEEYRKEYNQRPEVKEARKEYNRKRNEQLRVMRQLITE